MGTLPKIIGFSARLGSVKKHLLYYTTGNPDCQAEFLKNKKLTNYKLLPTQAQRLPPIPHRDVSDNMLLCVLREYA